MLARLRYGVQPKDAREGLRPGACTGKAHRREHLGYAGRRVLVSRKWSGKTLADHRGDRKAWLLTMLGLPVTDPGRYSWLLTVAQAAALLGTTQRFPRRLIAEQRIRFVRVGRHVRIPESALGEFIAAGMVEPLVSPRRGRVA